MRLCMFNTHKVLGLLSPVTCTMSLAGRCWLSSQSQARTHTPTALWHESSISWDDWYDTNCHIIAKSCELDPVPTWLLKHTTPPIAPVICHLCNLSTESDVFRVQLKRACVLPLLKKSTLDPDDASSYRPVSNLLHHSKLIERAVAFPNTRPSKTSCQFSSRFISLCTPLKRRYYQSITISFGRSILAIYPCLFCWTQCRFRHCGPWNILSVIENRFSVDSTALSWLKSYLFGRVQSFIYASDQTMAHSGPVPSSRVNSPVS